MGQARGAGGQARPNHLLKSAFDAIPQNWFEQAQIDGASEWQLFVEWGNFLWAMIVGEAREMWTMPVLIFTMHNWATAPSLVSAALVIMTLPPLLVFILANRTVQRGLAAKPW